MSTLKTTYIQHPSATGPAIELTAAGTVALPLSGIGDLADVDEGSGAADGDVLTYDGSSSLWLPQAIPAPEVVAGIGSNVVQAIKTDVFSTTSTSFVNVTGLSVTITPTSGSSKIFLIASVNYSAPIAATAGALRISGGNATTYVGDASGSRTRAVFGYRNTGSFRADAGFWPHTMVYLDSPATTSPVTYTVQALQAGGSTIRINMTTDTNAAIDLVRGASSLTAIEVAV